MAIARPCGTAGARRGASAARLTALALLICGIGCVGALNDAGADVRFGDSSWVAPAWPVVDDPTADGPRVAPRDHERPWETALRAPFRVAFFPLRVLAVGVEAGIGFAGPRYLDPKPPRPPKVGLAVAPDIALGALNDIGVGPALTWVGSPTADARLHLAGTWSAIDHRHARFFGTIGDRRPVGFHLSAEYEDTPNQRYYGIGNDTPVTHLGYFLLQSTDAAATLLLGGSPLRQLRIGGGYSSTTVRRGAHATPAVDDVFAPADAPFAHGNTRELWYGVAADLARLDDGRDPSRGVHGRIDLRRAAGLRAGDPDYDQWQVEGRAYLPVFAKRRVIAVRGVYAGVDPRGDATTILPLYDLAISGDASRFAGYDADRFRDRQLVHARIEYRWEVLQHLSALALYDLGEVAPRTGAFGLGRAHESYGGGLRVGMSDEATLRLEVAKSVEGLHAYFVLGGDF